MSEGTPALSVVMVVGTCRARAQRALDAIGAQTARADLEAILVDVAPAGTPPLAPPAGLAVRTLAEPGLLDYGLARTAGVRAARADAIAFVEDHAFAEPGWARAVIDAFADRAWTAVGYAFGNANPRNWISRSFLVAILGPWAVPAPDGPSQHLATNSVAYRRDALLALGDRLAPALDNDFNLQQVLRDGGAPMGLAAEARVMHENYTHVRPAARALYRASWLFAVRRVELERWSRARRLAGALAAPVYPWLRLLRLLQAVRGRPAVLRAGLAGLPLIVLLFVAAAAGEARGYLLPPGAASRKAGEIYLLTEHDPAPVAAPPRRG